MLAEKISGTYVGLWFLVAEHLRLGTWDLLTSWTGVKDVNAIEPRLALQMVHESALCVNGVRQRRALRQKGFETLNGLALVATDASMHRLLQQHTIAEAESLQIALGQLRYAKGHYPGKLILIDPHRIITCSQRQMTPRKASSSKPLGKNMQTFFAIDSESGQPFTFGIGSSSVTVSQATPRLIEHLQKIVPHKALLLCDSEHFAASLLNCFAKNQQFLAMIPAPRYKRILKMAAEMDFEPMWAGFAVGEGTYQLPRQDKPIRMIIQRTGETKENYEYKPFVTTSKDPSADLLTLLYPERWNIEEFFNTEAALGWNRASTFNLNIRFGKMSLALIAQAVVYEFRKKLPPEISHYTVENMARRIFGGIDGDIRVRNDTILVTLYNAPNTNYFKEHYENLPQKLEAEGIDPRVPWLYNYKVNFRFR